MPRNMTESHPSQPGRRAIISFGARSAFRPRDSVKVAAARSPPKARAEAMGPQSLSGSGAFFVVHDREEERWRNRPSTTWRTEARRSRARPRRSSGRAETQATMVDLKFCDLLGTWQHVTLPLTAFDESAFDEGLGFDGSSIRGWQGISESDMLLMPGSRRARSSIPFTEAPTLSLICEIVDPITREPYAKDPRRVAKRAEAYLRATGHRRHRATSAPSASSSSSTRSRYELADHGRTTRSTRPRATGTPASPGLGYTVREKEGYFPPAPHDTLHDLRTRDGADAGAARHPVRVPPPRGRLRRPVRDRPPLPDATRMADQVMTYKYVVKNVARAARQDARRSCRSRSSATTARACTRTSPSGRRARR